MDIKDAIDVIKNSDIRFSMIEHEAIQTLINCGNNAIEEERNNQCEFCREPGVYFVPHSCYKRCAKHKNGP